MVLSELSSRLTGALRTLGQKPRVDEEAMEACLKEITKALLEVRARELRRTRRCAARPPTLCCCCCCSPSRPRSLPLTLPPLCSRT
jgi:SRP54-type protein, helical bundle domain